jgi:predicted phosphodiesterase
VAKRFKSILIISDTHFPYQHPDTIAFLAALKDAHSPDKVVHIGDEIDGHSISMHSHSPDLMSPSDEFKSAIEKMQPLYKLFPKVDLVESNHGSLVYRRGTKYGLPREVFKSYREILQAPRGWRWHFDLTLEMSDGQKVYFTHGKTSATGRLSQSMGMSTVQGHYHERFEIFYWANPTGLYWDLRVGCLADDRSLALAYNNTNIKRPIMGCAVIINGQPKLCPMILNKRGRWVGKLL